MLPIEKDERSTRSMRLFTLAAILLLSAGGGCSRGTASSADASSSGASSSGASSSGASSSGASSSGASSSGSGGAGASSSSVSSSGSSSSGDAGAKIDRGPTAIPLDGDPNGLWWDSATGTLYIADDNHNRILQWTDSGGITLVAELPSAPQGGPGLGQIVKTKGGELVVTRFGYGSAGDVVYVAPDKTTGKVPGLDPTKRRIGLTVAADGAIYDAYFVKTASGQLGAVAKLDLAGTETDVIGSLKKPVGVLASGANLIISDQTAGTVLLAPLASPDKVTTLAQVEGPDLLCEGPNGSYFMGGTTGEVRQISSDGKLSTFAGGFLQIRGVAYDATNKRLFAAEHDAGGSMNTLRILPVN